MHYWLVVVSLAMCVVCLGFQILSLRKAAGGFAIVVCFPTIMLGGELVWLFRDLRVSPSVHPFWEGELLFYTSAATVLAAAMLHKNQTKVANRSASGLAAQVVGTERRETQTPLQNGAILRSATNEGLKRAKLQAVPHRSESDRFSSVTTDEEIHPAKFDLLMKRNYTRIKAQIEERQLLRELETLTDGDRPTAP